MFYKNWFGAKCELYAECLFSFLSKWIRTLRSNGCSQTSQLANCPIRTADGRLWLQSLWGFSGAPRLLRELIEMRWDVKRWQRQSTVLLCLKLLRKLCFEAISSHHSNMSWSSSSSTSAASLSFWRCSLEPQDQLLRLSDGEKKASRCFQNFLSAWFCFLGSAQRTRRLLDCAQTPEVRGQSGSGGGALRQWCELIGLCPRLAPSSRSCLAHLRGTKDPFVLFCSHVSVLRMWKRTFCSAWSIKLSVDSRK